MQIDEAIEFLNVNVLLSPKAFKFKEAVELANNALEKQIPKKIDYQKVDDIIVRFCPSCKVRFLRWGHKFCGECGQRLDWSER